VDEPRMRGVHSLAMLLIARRKFLRTSLSFPVAVAFTAQTAFRSPFSGALFPDDPHVAFPTSPRDRIAVASYPFREFIAGQHDEKALMASKMPLKDFAPQVLAKFNVRRVEPWSEHFLSLEPAYIDEIRNAASKAGCSFANIAADGDHSLYSPDPAERRRAMEFGKTWIGVAARLGSPSLRINLRGTKNAKPDARQVSAELKPVAEHAASKNVVVHLENDNPVSENPFFLASVLDNVNSRWLHALPDFGNSLAALPAEDAYRGLEQLFARAYAISHVKDTTTTPANQVIQVDLPRSFAIAAKHNYKGFFSMEWETAGDVYAGTSKLIDVTLANIS
jgi:sugar phosphate isomerase/epimerase